LFWRLSLCVRVVSLDPGMGLVRWVYACEYGGIIGWRGLKLGIGIGCFGVSLLGKVRVRYRAGYGLSGMGVLVLVD
jgi:hypothetical protein